MERGLLLSSSSIHKNSLIDIPSCSTKKASPAELIGLPLPRGQCTQKSPANIEQLNKVAVDADNEAKKCGVDIAKRIFFSKIISLASSTLLLVSAALLTGVTGGLGAPLLALAGVGFAVAVGDVVCAGYDLLNKGKGGDGLPKGADSIANALYWISGKCGVDHDKATDISSYASVLVRGALTISNVLTAFLVPVATPALLQNLGPAIALGNGALVTTVNTLNISAGLHTDIQNKLIENNARLQSEMKTSEKLADDHNNEIKEIIEQMKTLEESDDRNNEIIRMKTHELDKLGQKILCLEQENVSLQNETGKLINSVASVQSQLIASEDKIINLTNMLDHSNGELVKTRILLSNKDNELTALHSNLNARNDKFEDLQNALAKSEEDRNALIIAMSNAKDEMYAQILHLKRELEHAQNLAAGG